MNFASSNQRLDNVQCQGQKPILSGYNQGHRVLQTRQNEVNFSGVNADSNNCHITSKGVSSFEPHLGNGPELYKKNIGRMDFPESPVNYDFFSGQQQMSSQNSGLLQSFPKQQSGVSDMQLLQQQFMLKQMQEMLRHQQLQKQQFQHQEVRQLTSMNQVPTFARQVAGHSPAMINRIAVRDASNYSWQPELMAANTNWAAGGASPDMQGHFSGHMFSPEQNQAPYMTSLVHQNVDQSLYGVPVSGSRANLSQHTAVAMDKLQQISGNNNSFAGDEFSGFPQHVNVRDETLLSTRGYQGGNTIGSIDDQGLKSGFDLEHLQKTNPQLCNGPAQEIRARHELAGPSEALQEKAAAQVTPSQHVATLDPTEEKILFGSDDNLLDAFGSGIGSGGYNTLDGTDVFGAFPSIQSGSWSALMQSAVAETSGGDSGVREEYSGLTVHSNEPSAGNQQAPFTNDCGKPQSPWVDIGLQTAPTQNARPVSQPDGSKTATNFNNILGVEQSGGRTSHEESELLQTSSHLFHQRFLGDGSKTLDCSYSGKDISQRLEWQGQGHVEQSKFFNHIAKASMETEKGLMSGFKGDTRGLDEITSSLIDEAVRDQAPNLVTPTSENMLEIIHKVNESRDHGNALHFISASCNQPSEMLKTEISDGVVHPQPNQSSVSRGFGLQLTPHSQELAPDPVFSSQTQNPMWLNRVVSDAGERDRLWLAPKSSLPSSMLSHETSQRQSSNKMFGTLGQAGNDTHINLSAAFPSSFTFPKSHFANHNIYDRGGQTTTNPASASGDAFASLPKQMGALQRALNNQSVIASVPETARSASHNDSIPSAEASLKYAMVFGQQFPVLEASALTQHYTTGAMSRNDGSAKLSPTAWTSVSTRQRSFGSHPFDALSNMVRPSLSSKNNSDTTFSPLQKVEDQNAQRGSGPSESGASSTNSHGSVGKGKLAQGDPLLPVSPENDTSQQALIAEHGNEHFSGHLVADSRSTQREIEAFGRSLRPDKNLHQNYSLLHQVQEMKKTEVDLGDRSLKGLRIPDGALDPLSAATLRELQLHGPNNINRDGSVNRTSMPPGDSNMLSFSTKQTGDQDANELSQDMFVFGHSDSQNFSCSNTVVPLEGERSQTSPQVGPSWFDQYGTFKNRQILPSCDARKVATVKPVELSVPAGRHSDNVQSSIEQGNTIAADASQHAADQKSLNPSLASENLPTARLLCGNAADVALVVERPKKRKSATSELVPWHNDVMQGPQRRKQISVAEMDWAKATNRLTEKVEDGIEMFDDGQLVRSNKRLILTRQLMQLLLCPPATAVLFADSVADYQSVVYFIARSTLGDSCNAVSSAGRDVALPPGGGNILNEKFEASERIRGQHISEVVESLISRGRKLEHDLLRLDKRASILDLRVECQDLEKFSVINRFAKFHGRAQAESGDPLSASNTFQKCPQRYVTALPIPRNLPDRVQCLAL